MESGNDQVKTRRDSDSSIEIPEGLQDQIDAIVADNPPRYQWPPEQDEIVRQYYGKTTLKGVLKILHTLFPNCGLTKKQVVCRIDTLGLRE